MLIGIASFHQLVYQKAYEQKIVSKSKIGMPVSSLYSLMDLDLPVPGEPIISNRCGLL